MYKLLAIFLAIGAINVAVVQSKSTLRVQDVDGKILKLFGISNGGTNKVEIDDIVEEFEDLSDDKVSTFGPAFIKFANSLFKVNVAKNDIQSDVYDLEFNPQSIANYFDRYDGSLTLENVIVVIMNVVPSLKEALSSSESSATTTQQSTSVFVKFVSSSQTMTIKSIVAVLKQFSKQGVKKFGPVCIQIAKLYGYTITEKNIPSNVYKLSINIETIINKFNKLSEPMNPKSFFKMFGININIKTTTTPAPTTTAKSSISTAFRNFVTTSNEVYVELVKYGLEQQSSYGVTTLGPCIIEMGKLYGFELSEKDIPSSLINLKMNYTKVFSTLNSKTEPVDVLDFFKLFGINFNFSGSTTTAAPTTTTQSTISNDFRNFVTTSNTVYVSVIKYVLEKYSSQGAETFADCLIEMANLFGYEISEESIPLKFFKVKANYTSKLAAVEDETETFDVQSFFNIFGVTINFPSTTTTPMPEDNTIDTNTISAVFNSFISSNTEVKVILVEYLLQEYANKGTKTFGSFFIDWAELCGFNIDEEDIPSNIFNLKVDFAAVLSILRNKSGTVSVQNIFELLDIIINSSTPSTTPIPDENTIDTTTVSTDFNNFITSSNKVYVALVEYVLEKYSIQGAETFGQCLIEMANLFGYTISEESVLSRIFNLQVNYTYILSQVNEENETFDVKDFFNLFGLKFIPSITKPNSEDHTIDTTNISTALENVVTSSTKVKVILVEYILQECVNKGFDTFGSFFIKWAKLCGFELTENDMPSNIFSLEVDLSAILSILNNKSGSIDVSYLCQLFGITIKTPSSTTSISTAIPILEDNIIDSTNISIDFKNFITSKTEMEVILIEYILQKYSNRGSSTVGPFIIEWAKLCGFELTEKVIPSNIFNLQVDFPFILSIVNEKRGSMNISYLCKLFGITIIYEIPNTDINVPDTVSSDFKIFITTKEASTIIIRYIVEGLWKKGSTILGPFLIEFADMFRITLTQYDISSIIYNCPVTSTIIDAVLYRISLIEYITIEDLCKLFGITIIFDGSSTNTPDCEGVTETPKEVSTSVSELATDAPKDVTTETLQELSTNNNQTEVPAVSTQTPEESSTATVYVVTVTETPDDEDPSYSILLDLVSTDNEVSVSEIKALLQEILKGGNKTYANLLINLAEKYEIPFEQSKMPEDLYKYNADYSGALAALDEKNGSLKMEGLLELFGIKIHK
ncbi:uncharacterized protein LOC116344883 isoform X2 [Contarinia nasturtii]|uniref:uncharacterized protein LOC116344883 isoform X2 n=1 Tax=Contarinia nasturtii TaxID=265458 RepID=UPI0012D44447|nr:uncharacterized protein LOC116344883 isoform X2 [Contarinia nasturtii]